MSGGHLPKKLPSVSEGHAIADAIPVPASAGSGGIFSKNARATARGTLSLTTELKQGNSLA